MSFGITEGKIFIKKKSKVIILKLFCPSKNINRYLFQAQCRMDVRIVIGSPAGGREISGRRKGEITLGKEEEDRKYIRMK